MSKISDYPCTSCSLGQDCCTNLKGLKLTASEYKRHFIQYQEKIMVHQKNRSIYEVSSRQGQACPHWENGCIIYDDRPVECRIFPHTIGKISFYHGQISLTVHARSNCPQKQILLLPWDETKRLVSLFARDAFGNEPIIKVKRETLICRLVNRLMEIFNPAVTTFN